MISSCPLPPPCQNYFGVPQPPQMHYKYHATDSLPVYPHFPNRYVKIKTKIKKKWSQGGFAHSDDNAWG